MLRMEKIELQTDPIKVESVGPDHPEPVEGVEPEEDDHEADQETPSVAIVDSLVLRRTVVIPPPSLVVPPPAVSNINKTLLETFIKILKSNLHLWWLQ